MMFPSHKDALYQNWLKWPDGFREEVKNVTGLQTDRKTDGQTDGRTDRRAKDNWSSEKLT